MKYPVHERFLTFQGEGDHMGRQAYFLRLFGCPVHCPWCDSAGTWHRDWVPKDVAKMEVEEILKEVTEAGVKTIVVTGGEPAMFDLRPLVEAAHLEGWDVHLETSGGFFINGDPDWITLSPKRWKLPLPENIVRADEFKVIVENLDDIEYYKQVLEDGGMRFNGLDERSVWLHPEWGHREDPVVLGAISDTVRFKGHPYRAGWQMHKLYRVDSRDIRTRQLVPLGGDLRKGF